jgi:hypothetical protein
VVELTSSPTVTWIVMTLPRLLDIGAKVFRNKTASCNDGPQNAYVH